MCSKVKEAVEYRLSTIRYMAEPAANASRELRLEIVGFRDMSAGTHTSIGLGAAVAGGIVGAAIAGATTNDRIDVRVEVVDRLTGNVTLRGEFSYGAASGHDRSEEELADGVATRIVDFLRGRPERE